MNIDHNKIAVGKYLVSPLAKDQGEGRYAASVSIRSGKGMSSIDRVFRFKSSFSDALAALQYATAEGTSWALQR